MQGRHLGALRVNNKDDHRLNLFINIRSMSVIVLENRLPTTASATGSDFSMTDFHEVTSDHCLTTLPSLLILFFSSGNFNSLFSTVAEPERKTAVKPQSNAISVWEKSWKIHSALFPRSESLVKFYNSI